MADGNGRVLLYEEALAEVLAAAGALRSAVGLSRGTGNTERLPLLRAVGRVLAEPLTAERDQPPFARSTRDGFAVRAGDLAAGMADGLQVVGTVRAGELWRGAALQTGQALEIMTGAPVPEGADAVLMVEHAALTEGQRLHPAPGRGLRVGENIVPRAAEAAAGAVLVPPGRVLGAAEVALAASCGYAEVGVFGRPRVAILATGDELVELHEMPEAWQIRNSNSYALAALVGAENGEALRLPVARDNREDLEGRIAEGRRTDLLLLSGGVSMGKYDLVEQALSEAGAEFVFTGTRIQPGRPLVFGRLPKTKASASQHGAATEVTPAAEWTYFFGLPGNPISTEVCFRLFVTPLLRALAGYAELPPRFAEARLAEDVRGGAGVTRFLPAEITGDWQGIMAKLVAWQGSGDLAANARANGFVVLPIAVESFHAGETVRVLLR